MASQKHTVYDLERESGIKARTIRKYIQMGLVPQAETRGPGPAYTDDHLARLKVVELLRGKNRSLTLDKIRLILQQMSPEDIQAIASGKAQVEALVDTDEQESTALEYIRSLRGKSADQAEPLLSKQMAIPSMSIEQSVERDRERDETKQTTVEQIVDALEQLSGRRSSPRSVRKETWQRIEITPDIELSIRGDFDEEQQTQFYRVADLLRYLLARGVK